MAKDYSLGYNNPIRGASEDKIIKATLQIALEQGQEPVDKAIAVIKNALQNTDVNLSQGILAMIIICNEKFGGFALAKNICPCAGCNYKRLEDFCDHVSETMRENLIDIVDNAFKSLDTKMNDTVAEKKADEVIQTKGTSEALDLILKAASENDGKPN